jgi:Ferritin-like domain
MRNGNPSAKNRRSFLQASLATGGAIAGATVLGAPKLFAQTSPSTSEQSSIFASSERLTTGDVAILKFLAAAELIEADLWTQYAELGGIGNNPPIEIDPNKGAELNPYQMALSNLDPDGPQYITSNTLDEVSHVTFLDAYLVSKGEEAVNLDAFRTLQGSKATGSSNIGRLTNLTNLTVDTSWYVRYRSTTNPDFGATFPQAVTITNRTAIPITNADFNNTNHIQAIANTAAFHFGYIEQGGSSLYQAMSQKVSSLEVLKITLGIGGDEIAHFLEWVDFSGNGVQAPVAPVTDGALTFPDFFNNPPLQPPSLVQPSLIFPVPCEFISSDLPLCAVIRPSDDKFAGAVATIQSFTNDGLFIGQTPQFLQLLNHLAQEADEATRQVL